MSNSSFVISFGNVVDEDDQISNPSLGCKTLFATHYFELTHLEQSLSRVKNMHLDAIEHGEEIVFLHEIKPGPASKSYRIQVTQLAGLPRDVIKDAKTILASLEQQKTPFSALEEKSSKKDSPQQVELFPTLSPNELKILEQIKQCDVDNLTPRQALDLLYIMKGKQL